MEYLILYVALVLEDDVRLNSSDFIVGSFQWEFSFPVRLDSRHQIIGTPWRRND